MKKCSFVVFMLLVSVSYSIFVWWFFDRNQVVIMNGKSVQCTPVSDTVSVTDTIDFRPIIEHSKILKR